MKKSLILLCTGLSLLLASCTQQWNKGQSGAAIGAAGGAVAGQAIGHNTEATLIGALVGTMVGYMIGNEMDKYDRQQLNHVYERGVSGQTSSWKNPDSGHMYNVTPNPATTGSSGPCRDAQIEAIIGGKPQITHSTACRDYNGQWVLQ
jgi:surface antigen